MLGVDWQDTRADKARQLARRSGVTYPLVADREPGDPRAGSSPS